MKSSSMRLVCISAIIACCRRLPTGESFVVVPTRSSRPVASKLNLIPPHQYQHLVSTLLEETSAATPGVSPWTVLQHDPNLSALTGAFGQVWQSYANHLRDYPLSTQSATATVLAVTGDALAQQRSVDGSYDIRRGATFGLLGALYTGAFQHVWFDFLSSHVMEWGDGLGWWGPMNVVDVPLESIEWWRYFDVVSALEHPPSPTALAAAKVALNQFIMVPTVYMPLFFLFTSQLDWRDAYRRAQDLYVSILVRNYMFWLPVQFFQFFFLPQEWQIPFLSAASLVWTVILSSIGSTASAEQQVADQSPPTVSVYNEDDVTFEDVREALVPESVNRAIDDERFGGALTGLLVGLVSSTADDAMLGELVSNLLNGNNDPEASAELGVTLLSWLGATLGLWTAVSSNDNEAVTDKESATKSDGEIEIVNVIPVPQALEGPVSAASTNNPSVFLLDEKPTGEPRHAPSPNPSDISSLPNNQASR